MSSPRLRSQFERLFQHFNGENSQTQLEEITDILYCTRRNARIVLSKLSDEGWIEWQPAAGRGKLSSLIFKLHQSDVREKLATNYLEEGKVDQALKVLDHDSNHLSQVIQGYLGIQHQQGSQVLRLPYYRPLSMLNPLKFMRRSEQHIACQIFSGLTKLDEEGQLQPDLAHHWHAISPTHWRFYLRSGVRFHNGECLTTGIAIESLLSLRRFQQFAHIHHICSETEQVIDIHLSAADVRLPLTLSASCAKIILPQHQLQPQFDRLPIGTGPYQVVKNDDKQLVLQAFDLYFGYRALIDKVEVWVVDEAYSTVVFPSLSHPVLPERNSRNEVDLDPGCTYLLLNRKTGLAQDPQWTTFLSKALSSIHLFKHLPHDIVVDMGLIHAYGLKPGWYDLPTPAQNVDKAPHPARLTIAYQANHPLFPAVAKVVQTILAPLGVRVECHSYEHHLPADETVIDIWIKPMGLANHRDDALGGWLLDDSGIESNSDADDFADCVSLVNQWRADTHSRFPARALGKQLVESGQIIPMFHCWLGVNHDHCGTLQNAKCNALGWFDFSQVWVKPSGEPQC